MSTLQGTYQGSVRGIGPHIDHVILDLRLLILLLLFVAANIYRHHRLRSIPSDQLSFQSGNAIC